MGSHAIARFAVWNLAGFDRIEATSQKAHRQAEGLAVLDADFVTLVEVNPISHIDTLLRKLRDDFGVDYTATIRPQPNSNLHIGFLHKPAMQVGNARFIAGSEGDYAGGRQAIAVDVRMERFKAIVVGVHLKSGRGAAEQRLRDTQCRVIGNWLATVRDTSPYGAHTLVLNGDFNMIPGQDVSNFHHLGGADVMDFLSCWDLQDRYSHILDRGRANLLDGFAISRTFSRDYVRGSLRLFAMHWSMDTDRAHPGMGRERFKQEVSDHLPFTASFRVF